MKLIFIIFCSFSLAIAFEPNWINFKSKHGIKFEKKLDESHAFLNYRLNQAKREKHNADETKTFKMAENKFSHLSFKQFSNRYCKTNLPEEHKASKRIKRQVLVAAEIVTIPPPTTTTTVKTTTKAPSVSINIFGNFTTLNLPPSIDYSHLMLPVVDQGDCGSCWAVAAMAQIQAVLKFKYPFFNIQLSPQILLDCDWVNAGCNGGWPYDTMKWLRSSLGGRNMAPSISSYPYLATNNTCSNNTLSFIPLGLKTAKQLNYADETTLMLQLANCGPQVVAIYASDSFVQYSNGVFRDTNCFTGNCDEVNHSMVVVGYGDDPVYGPYWLCKNTWGDSWGENGYIRIARNAGNMCNIACFPQFAQ